MKKDSCKHCFHHLPDGWCCNKYRITSEDYSCNDWVSNNTWKYKK